MEIITLSLSNTDHTAGTNLGNRQMLCHLIFPRPLSQSLRCRRGKVDAEVTDLLPGMCLGRTGALVRPQSRGLCYLGPTSLSQVPGVSTSSQRQARSPEPPGEGGPCRLGTALSGRTEGPGSLANARVPSFGEASDSSRSTFLTYCRGWDAESELRLGETECGSDIDMGGKHENFVLFLHVKNKV